MKSKRIQSIDVLRGVVMVIMALDHCRDYFYFGGGLEDPTNLETTYPFLFFTRFITHYCAPIFVFLAGTSAFLYGQKKSKKELTKFLFIRGLWLIFLELTVNNFIWFFDPSFEFINLQVLWAIGFSMVVLSALIHLPKRVLLGLAVLIIAAHNLLDGIVMEGYSASAIFWYFFHQQMFLPISESRVIFFNYPIFAWIGVMSMGYCFGELYKKGFDADVRRTWLLRIGVGSLILFFLLRSINVYGNLTPWTVQKDTVFTFLSFMNITKYPPSLLFILFTIGCGILFLYFMENVKNRFTNFFLVYGRVPFFYYFLHMIVIHSLSIIVLLILGREWDIMILDMEVITSGALSTYGYPLWVTYLVWVGVVLALYPVCNWYMRYKANNKEKWWLSYL